MRNRKSATGEQLEREPVERELVEREAAYDDFLAQLSHELRTPLHAVIGWTEMLIAEVSAALEDEARAATLQRGLQVILRNAKLQARLIDDMADMTSLARGGLALALAPLSVDGVVRAAVDSVSSTARARNVHLHVALATPEVLVLLDAQRLQQVIANLLGNAVKFSPAGAAVHVRTQRRERCVVIEVEDGGPGIEPEVLPVLFDRFRQGRAGRSAGTGMGLGLAIAKGLVELHGGEVAAFSKGSGALLTVQLPLAPDGSRSAPPPLPEPLDATLLSGRRVAVVDDEPDAVEAVRSTLLRAGASVDAFTSPDELLSSELRADVLLLDIGMDDWSGLELLAELRARGVNAPAIALTGYALPRDRLRALGAGFQVHIGKPVDGRELLAAVARALAVADP